MAALRVDPVASLQRASGQLANIQWDDPPDEALAFSFSI
jgi:hypothetical protein